VDRAALIRPLSPWEHAALSSARLRGLRIGEQVNETALVRPLAFLRKT